ncbi:MAG TPA: HAD hydrolase family protein [Pirellulales bacterium]|jgi:YrbI family 3-deoxy-D-manno-octulosonate 8-phosphate phosphatase|nr:HAD hydrolase family protein [Pirellulales bacterium]
MTVAKQVYQAIELILSDVDGVLTDGSIVFNNEGIESKRFHIRDGLAIKLWARAGGKFGVLTGRNSHIVNLRSAELGIEIVRQGVENKLAAMKEILAELRLEPAQVCYIGDDLPDLAPMRAAGLAITVPEAAAEVRSAAGYVTKQSGGHGAVREAIEVILKAQGRWNDLVQKYDP